MFRRKRSDSDFRAETEAHIENETTRLREQGLTEIDARASARRSFGNLLHAEETFYESRRWLWWDRLRQHVGFGLRMLRRSPTFTAVTALTLALGIGANTAIFSLINAVELRLLPVPNPQELVLLQWTAKHEPKTNFFARWAGCPSGSGRSSPAPTACSFSYPMFQEIRSKKDIFSGVLAFIPSFTALRADEHAEQSSGMYVSGDFFPTLGAKSAAGRLLSANDDVSGAEPVIVLSYRYWRRGLGGNPEVVGKIATVSLKPFRIVGITARDFPDLDPGRPVDFWIPLAAETVVDPHSPSRTADNSLWLYLLARRKPEVTTSQAEAELNTTFVVSSASGPTAPFKPEDAPRIKLYRAAEGLATLRTEYATPLYVLMAAVGLILLLTCANVAGLMLARTSARQKELAVRNALGAPRLRIVRQLLTESVILSVAGGVLGILVAELAARSLVAFLSANSYFPLQIDIGLDWRVLGFTLAVSILVGIFFGLAPAMRNSRLDVTPILKLSGSQSGTTPRESARLSHGLVIAQVVISILVLAGAGLLGRTVLNLRNADAGFRTQNLLLFDVDMTASGLKFDDPQCYQLNEGLRNRFAAIPGGSSATYSNFPLLSGIDAGSVFRLPGEAPAAVRQSYVLPVGPTFSRPWGYH